MPTLKQIIMYAIALIAIGAFTGEQLLIKLGIAIILLPIVYFIIILIIRISLYAFEAIMEA